MQWGQRMRTADHTQTDSSQQPRRVLPEKKSSDKELVSAHKGRVT